MSRRFIPPTSEERARLREMAERPLPVSEFLRRAAIPLTDEEVEANAELVRWFRRRYPTPLDRFRYCDREYAAWTRPPVPPK